MKKSLFHIAILILLLTQTANAGIRFSSGIEWGYKTSFFHKHHYNYLSVDGVRVNDQGKNFEAFSNGEIYLYTGAYLTDNVNLSLYGGYSGIYIDRRIYPVSLRATYFFNGRSEDGLKAFVDAGSAFADTFSKHRPFLCKGAIGYRFALDKDWGLDLNLIVESAADQPTKVIDKYAGTVVRETDLRRCEYSHLLVGASISLNF